MHDMIMLQSSQPDRYVSFIKLEVLESYHFYCEFDSRTFNVAFEDVWYMYNMKRLDTTFMRVGILWQSKDDRCN